VKEIVQQLCDRYPARGVLTGVVYQGRLYVLKKAEYSRGQRYIIWPGPQAPQLNGTEGDLVVAPASEEPQRLEEAYELKPAKLTVKYVYVYQREYAVFRAVVSYQPENKPYLILEASDLLATFTAKWANAGEETYRFREVPAWMHAKAKITRAANPGLWVGVENAGRYVGISASKLLSVNLTIIEQARPQAPTVPVASTVVQGEAASSVEVESETAIPERVRALVEVIGPESEVKQ